MLSQPFGREPFKNDKKRFPVSHVKVFDRPSGHTLGSVWGNKFWQHSKTWKYVPRKDVHMTFGLSNFKTHEKIKEDF